MLKSYVIRYDSSQHLVAAIKSMGDPDNSGTMQETSHGMLNVFFQQINASALFGKKWEMTFQTLIP